MIVELLVHLAEILLIGYIGGVCLSDFIDTWFTTKHE
jgi:hypothetical protein